MPKPRTILRILGLATITLLAWIAFQPPRGHPDVSIKLLHYTNDPTGLPLAVIGVTNLNAYEIFIGHPSITVPAPTEPGGFAYSLPDRKYAWHATLRGGASASFTIPPPTNPSSWRLSFNVYNDVGTAQAIKRLLAPKGPRRFFYIDSDWIAAYPEITTSK